VLTVVLVTVLSLGCTNDAPPRQSPNAVLIVADDLGYADVGYQGAPADRTPNIDALANEGTVFSEAYVAAPICAPSRAALMTGRHPARYGYLGFTGTIENQIENDIGVDPRERFLTELMRDAGYTTAAVGKWHLGYNEKYRPGSRGVDHFFGFLAGGHDYYLWNDPSRRRAGGPILRNGDEVDGRGYLTEAFTEEAVAFIRENRTHPFFLYLAYQNPHPPKTVPKRYQGPDGDTHVGMIRALDAGVGAVLAAIEATDLERDTIVVFLSDNGGSDNGPLRGRKGSLFEGGIRVVMVMRWPGHIAAGETFSQPVSAMDLLPTLIAAAGGEPPSDRRLDGVDLLPYLTREREGPPHEQLFWRFYPHGEAVRSGPLKLLVSGPHEQLFDLSADPGERNDLAQERETDVARLRAALEAWSRNVSSPDSSPRGPE
jgi:arylsulfatase A-like enzyme